MTPWSQNATQGTSADCLDARSDFIFQLRDYPCDITHDRYIFFIYHGYF